MDKQNIAGNLMGIVARRNGYKSNKEISKVTNTNYELVNRGLRDDSLIGDTFLNNFLETFSDVTIEEEKIIKLNVELAKSSNLLREEFLRMKMLLEKYKEEDVKNEAETIMSEAFQYALKRGLAEAILNFEKKK